MVTVTLGSKAKNYDFNVSDIDFKSIMKEDYNIVLAKKDSAGNEVMKLVQDKNNYVELHGDFSWFTIKKISSIVTYENGTLSYTVSGLDLTSKDTKNASAFADYIAAHEYKINGNAYANDITGADNNDSLFGNGGNDALYGMGGNDKIDGGDGSDKLFGGDGNDTLYGQASDDRLDGGKGADKLFGGDGNDTYVYDGADTISETAKGGTDTVESAKDVTLADFKYIEGVVLTGSRDVDATGDAGANSLVGNGGENRLDGGKGADQMKGGAGDDTYVIDSKGDTIVETAKGGDDAVVSTVSVDLSKFAYVEDVFLFGKADIGAKGNSLDNALKGNDGDNLLWGAKGDDVLTGGDGSDTFRYVKGDGTDTITDFDASGRGQDHLDLSGFGAHLKFKNMSIELFGKHNIAVDFGRGDELILKGVDLKEIDVSDFLF